MTEYVRTDCVPYGRSREFALSERQLYELVAAAEKMEART